MHRRLALAVAAVYAASLPAQSPPAQLDSTARRNENTQVNRIDNDAIKEAGVRIGATTTILSEAPVEATYYATEHGRAPAETTFLPPAPAKRRWRGELFESHQNSVFNARTFFQAGPVLPSHRNIYGARFTSGAGRLGWITFNATQRQIRGMVNGNVLVPLAEERTPLAADSAVHGVIARWLRAYPAGLPNRPDFDPRALNTNAPQRIDETDGDLRLDRDIGSRGRLSGFYALSRQRVDAFELVAGQNPDMEIHSHRARLTYRETLSSGTELSLGAGFNRVRSLLLPEPNAVGPRVRFGFQIEELGPDSMFPVNRAYNSFRGGAGMRKLAGASRHTITLGGDIIRFQVNGVESNNQRGQFQFGNNWGRTALENFLLGMPTTYEVTIGELARGYRNWAANVYAADKVKLAPSFDLYFGLRYGLLTAPYEVNGLDNIPYGCDCNNFSPRFAFAWRVRGGWTVRASYSVSFGEIQPVTYQQVRNNLPHVRYLQVQNPDLLNPLRGIDLNAATTRTSPTVLAPDLVSPYSHQYNLTIERRTAAGYVMRIGYIGSRSFKLPNSYIFNRGEPAPGMTTANVDQRRRDPRYYDVKMIVNGGIAYLDAAQAAIELPRAHGFTAGASYTFGKAIDEGADYTNTAANKDLINSRNQWQYEALKDKKELSTFDSTHALSFYWFYDLPRLGRVLNGWQISGASVLKSGTPLTLFVGSDAPGYGNVDGGPSDRPNILDPSILGKTFANPNEAPLILKRERFAYIRLGENRGNLGRGTFRKSPIANFNAALGKQWRWGNGADRMLTCRLEAYNLTNHPQFDEPQRNLSSPAFGKITNTLNDGRVLQLGVRLVL